MNDIAQTLSTLRRPRLLIRAARIGADTYQPERHLTRLLGYGSKKRGAQALAGLIEMEQNLNDKRREADASYNIARHVDVLSAMMGEARLLRMAESTAKITPLYACAS